MTNPILPPCPKCEARLFQVYAGGTKEKVEGVFWCKACKSGFFKTEKFSYELGNLGIKK